MASCSRHLASSISLAATRSRHLARGTSHVACRPGTKGLSPLLVVRPSRHEGLIAPHSRCGRTGGRGVGGREELIARRDCNAEDSPLQAHSSRCTDCSSHTLERPWRWGGGREMGLIGEVVERGPPAQLCPNDGVGLVERQLVRLVPPRRAHPSPACCAGPPGSRRAPAATRAPAECRKRRSPRTPHRRR